MLCFAINDQNSFVELKELHSAILRLRDNNSKTPCVVVACKCDLEGERDVDVATAKAWSDSIKAPFIETSAKVCLLKLPPSVTFAVDLLDKQKRR